MGRCGVKPYPSTMVTDTILENSFEVYVGKNYEVKPPTLATLIEVSKYINTIPPLDIASDESAVKHALSMAKDTAFIGDVLAILILGKNRLERRILGFKIDRKKRLAKRILNHLTPKEAFEVFFTIINSMGIAFFLQTIIFLDEVNLTKPTKTTASGQL